MKCPVCPGEALIVLEHHEVEVDYCPNCHGVWLDAGEMELLFESKEACVQFLSIGSPAVVPKGEKPRRCPECDKKMNKESTSNDKPVTFDHCPNEHGIWLDGGELAVVLDHAESLSDGNTVSKYLSEIFRSSDAAPKPVE